VDDAAEIEQVIEAMQGAPTGELATPYLTEFQARISFALACLTFVIVGMPPGHPRRKRRETSIGILLTIGIVMVYWLLVTLGKALKLILGFIPS